MILVANNVDADFAIWL
ncbi:unnamed protein product, partial [Rotaria magnacalcarata]